MLVLLSVNAQSNITGNHHKTRVNEMAALKRCELHHEKTLYDVPIMPP